MDFFPGFCHLYLCSLFFLCFSIFFNMHCHYRLIYHLSSDMQGCFFSHNRFRRKVADSTGRA